MSDKFNFDLIKEVDLNEINSIGYLYKHISGAELVFIKNNDQNKVFSVAFRTFPDDDKGAAHVLEHCTLCGSKKYPLKDTFSEMASSCFYTYLNAMTFKDKTVYPLASMYEQELKKLIDIYLDCVFNPLLRLESFLHEAWHYENLKDNINVNGIVYSEMKSTFSNPVRETRSFIHKNLFPDRFYKYESSGKPKKILELKHKDIIDFHNKYYRPNNCFLYLYGNISFIESYLELFNKYLDLDKNNNQSQDFFYIKKQDDLKAPVVVNGLYDYSGAQKKYFGAGFLVNNILDSELVMAFDILNSYLCKMIGAPLKKFLPLVKTFFESEIYQPVYSILSENFNGSLEKFKETISQIFIHICKSGLNKAILESCINNLEFELKTGFNKNRPKGLVINLLILKSWIYGGDAFEKINRLKILNNIRARLKDNYFEGIIKNYFLDNNSWAFVCLIPDSKNKFSFETTNKDIKNAMIMRKFIDTPEENLGLIKLADLNIAKYNGFDDLINNSDDNIKIFHTEIDTQGIIYLCFCFRTDKVPEKYLCYIGILCEVLIFVALEKENKGYDISIQAIINNLGNIKLNFETYSKDDKKYLPVLDLRVKTLPSNINNVIDTVNKIFSLKDFDSESLIKKLVSQKYSKMSNLFMTKHIDYVKRKILSYSLDEYKYRDKVDGFEFFSFIKALNKDFDSEYKKLLKPLLNIFNMIFKKENLFVNITCGKKEFDNIYSKINNLIKDSLGSKKTDKSFDLSKILISKDNQEQEICDYKFDLYKTNQAFFNLSLVNTNAMIIKLKNNNKDNIGSMKVFETFMNKIYLMQEVRINGGAYDCGCGFKNNNVYFYSYADPNIISTYKKFIDAADFVLDFNFDLDKNNYLKKSIIGAINTFDKPKSIQERANLSLARYLIKIDFDYIKKIREQILNTSAQDLKNIALEIKNNIGKRMIFTLGNRSKIYDNQKLFSEINKI